MNKPGGKSILIVEDEPAICELCRRILTEEGYEVYNAPNGKMAQEIMGKRRYDLCLVDIKMPAMSGRELYQWLKERHPQLVGGVIFITGDVMGEDTQTFLVQSGRPFLPKPFSPDELRAILRETLTRREG